MTTRYLKNIKHSTNASTSREKTVSKVKFFPDTDEHYFKVLENHFPKEQIDSFRKVRNSEDFRVYCEYLARQHRSIHAD